MEQFFPPCLVIVDIIQHTHSTQYSFCVPSFANKVVTKTDLGSDLSANISSECVPKLTLCMTLWAGHVGRGSLPPSDPVCSTRAMDADQGCCL